MTGPFPGLTTTVEDVVTVVGLLASVTVGFFPTSPVTLTALRDAGAAALLALLVALLLGVGPSALAQPATSSAGSAVAASSRGSRRRTSGPLVEKPGRSSLTRQPVHDGPPSRAGRRTG